MPVADTSYPLRGGAAPAMGIPPSGDTLLMTPFLDTTQPVGFQGYAKRTLDPLPEPLAPPEDESEPLKPSLEPISAVRSPRTTKGLTVSLIITMALLITMGLFMASLWRHHRSSM